MPAHIFMKKIRFNIVCILASLLSANAYSQVIAPEKREAVIEVRNFTEEKMLPALNQLLKDEGAVEISGYCIGQDLVVFSYDNKEFNSSQDVVIFLQDKGYIAYLKENMTPEQVISVCKSPFKKINK